MFIKSVRLHNIRSYLDEEVHFPQGSVLLSGDIGSGKSTILLAIEFALFGISKGMLSGDALLRHDKQSGFVELCFSLDKNEVAIRRSLKRLKDSIRQDEGFLVINSVKQFCTAEELKARVLELLGYPKELLRKSKGLIYRFTVYTPQEEMKRILFEDPQLRLDTLRQVFQVEKYKLVKEGAAVVMQALREKKRELSARIDDLPQKKQQVKELLSELAAVEQKLAALMPAIGKTEQLFQQSQAALKSVEDKARQLNLAKSQLAAALAVLDEKKRLIASKDAEVVQARNDSARLKLQVQDNSAAITQLSSCLSRLEAFSESLLKDAGMKSSLEGELLAAEQLRFEVESEISRAEALKSSSLQLQQKISVLSSCPTCLQPVSVGHKHKISSEEQAKVAMLEAKLGAAFEKKTAVADKIKRLKAGLSELQAKENAAARLASELKQYFELASSFGAGIHEEAASSSMAVADMQADLGILVAVKKKLDSGREKLFMISEKERFIQAAEKLAGGYREEANLLASRREELSALISSFGDVESEIATLQGSLDVIAGEKTRLMVQNASLGKEKENVNNLLKLLSDEVGRKEAAREELESANNVNYWLGEMFMNLVAVIEKHVMMKVHQEFDELFREWFVMLMGNENLTARIDEEFTPVVEVNGFGIPVENLSGGEKTSCALAYRLALNMVINNLVSTIRTKDTLILDEPTDGFSAEQLNKLRDVLAQLGLPQIIIVSHEERIETFVQHVMNISKEQHVSRVVA